MLFFMFLQFQEQALFRLKILQMAKFALIHHNKYSHLS